MSNDNDLITTEQQDLNFILDKFCKKKSKANKDLLKIKIKEFQIDMEYAPHNKVNFYKFADEINLISKLEEDTTMKKAKVDLNQFLAEIERKAYEIYEERKQNHVSGDDFTDWLRAEQEIKQKYNMG